MSHYQFCLHNKLHPQSSTYNIPAVFKIHGELNIDALRESIATVILCHEALRMTFPRPSELLGAKILESPLNVLEQTDLGETGNSKPLEQWLDEEITRPFDIVAGPLLRLHLFRLQSNLFVLLIVQHHSITDLRSKELLGCQISACYDAIVQNKSPLSLACSSQYSSHLKHMQAWLASSAADRMREFWKKELSDCEGLIQLPLDHPRPSVAVSAGRAHFFNFGPELSATLHDACKRISAAPFTVLLTCYLILLSRYSRQKAMVIGVPLSNRRCDLDKEAIGCYVNILPLVFDLPENTTVRQALGMVRGKLLQAHRNQELPFHEIVAAVQPQREPSYNPIFQVGFTYEPPMPMQLAGLTVESEKRHNQGAQMDLFLNIFEMSPSIQGYFEYDQALFDPSTVSAISRNYEGLLAKWHNDIDQAIDSIDLLSPEERYKLIRQWNDTAADYGAAECIHRLFERQAAKTPSAPALVYNDTMLTYQELNCRANQLAHYIIAKGGGPESIVGVFMERSIEMVVALYGVLKAGAAYLPLEPDLPAQRLSFILEESRAAVLLTQDHLHAKLPEFKGAALRLDSEWPAIAQYPHGNPESKARSDNLAYVIYTSGSTGQPKGVMVEHVSLFNRLKWMQATYRLTSDDRVLQKTPFGFDVSVWEFFWPLMTGAILVIPPPDIHRDPVKLCEVIRRHQITTIHFVPSMLRLFLDTDDAVRCACLKRVFCSGEALSWSLQSVFFEKLDCELHNLYGPTEATVDVTYWDCRQRIYPGKVPIGYPVANTLLYILDDYMKPVPTGVTGDLYIGGVQVARGYLRREELTRDRFIPDPFDESGQARLYKTGDLARYLPDGAIEYIGRADFQIKLFGNRIELGEIEAALRRHPMIADAVVTLFGEEKERQQLGAYLLTDATDTESLAPKKHLMEILPYYMIPTQYLLLKEFPLTGSGKTDRKRLPRIHQKQENMGVPANGDQAERDWESVIADIWGKILNADDVDVDCNFFDAGGTSLQVAELAARVEHELGIRIPVVKVFQYPTIAALAGHIATKAKA